MARTKNAPDTAPSAAHAATDPAPVPGTAPAADIPAAAVHAALAASPGSPVAVIADAAGTGKPAARAALLEMEKAGTATRVKGARPGIPDTWTLAGPAPDAAGPAADLEAGQPSQPEPDNGTPDGAAEDKTAGDTAPQDGETAPQDGDDAEAGAPAAPGPETAEPEPHDAPAEGAHEDAAPDEQDAGAEPGSGPDDGGAPREDGAPEDPDAGDAPAPALAGDLIRHIDQIKAAANAAELVLTANGDLKAVLAGMDEIRERAAQARRTLKAAASGRKAPAVKPGALRELVAAHLAAHPGKDFGPHEIGKVLGRSSGAVANALDRLTSLNQARLTSEKPRRFQAAA